MKPIEFFLAYRFLKEGRSQSLLIFGGAAVGVAVIVFLFSLIGGLQQTIIDQTTGLQSDITVEPRERDQVETLRDVDEHEYLFSRAEPRPGRPDQLDAWPRLARQLRDHPEILAASPVAAGTGSVLRGAVSEPAQIRGVDPDLHQQIIDVEGRLLAGDFRVANQGTVIGVEMADRLDVELGDRVRFAVAEAESRTFTVQGIFDLGASGPNETWAYISIREAQSLFELGEEITNVDAAVEELFDADRIAEAIQPRVEHDVQSWQDANQDLLRALRTQNASTILIAVFVAISVALGIASVLIVTVVQKRGQVGVLRAMGASMNTILRVFLIQGAAVGLVGSVFGSILGIAMALGFNRLIRDEAGEAIFPIEPSPSIFAVACLLATLTGLLAAVAPARRAARLDPADAITHG